MAGEKTRFKSGAEAAEKGRKGGIKSGEARRKKAAMRDVAAMILGLKPELSQGAKKQLENMGIDVEEVTMQTMALLKQSEKAAKGDLAALTFLRDTAGERPREGVDLSHTMTDDFKLKIKGKTDAND